jgi:hypothetical protein
VKEKTMPNLHRTLRTAVASAFRKERRKRTHASRISLAGAITALLVAATTMDAAVAGDAPPSHPLESPSTATATLPGDSAVPFWPHETGVSVGTSETYIDVREDGSYLDPGIGRRVFLAGDADAPRLG